MKQGWRRRRKLGHVRKERRERGRQRRGCARRTGRHHTTTKAAVRPRSESRHLGVRQHQRRRRPVLRETRTLKVVGLHEELLALLLLLLSVLSGERVEGIMRLTRVLSL